uniref:Putative capsid protein n=1 Tax=viral metagenome TaxID=1070528 RepID=A0A6M3KTC3_9ZZZZ
MTTYSLSTYVTALELSNQVAPDGSLLPLIQGLSKRMAIFGDVHMERCNDGTGHQGTTEYYQPTGTWRAFNEGVASHAPISYPFREPTAMMADIFKCDRRLLLQKAGGDKAKAGALRAQMVGQFIAGMLKTVSTAMLYGTRSDGKSPLGITERSDYNALSSAYVHDNAGGAASATANKTSLFVIGHGAEKYHWIYPTGFDGPPSNVVPQPGQAIQGFGLFMESLRDDLITDVGGTNEFMAVRNWIEGAYGHCIEDARYVQRVCNISTSNIDNVDDFSIDEDVITDALVAIPDKERAVIYGNATLEGQFIKRANTKGNVWHMDKDPFGYAAVEDKVPFFGNIPFHRWDSIVDTEATVT